MKAAAASRSGAFLSDANIMGYNTNHLTVRFSMVSMTQGQHRFISPDEADGIAYWSSREWKKWAVHIVAGPVKRPTYKRTAYVRARTAQAAISVARREVYPSPPRSARFDARMSGPRELGCVVTNVAASNAVHARHMAVAPASFERKS